MKVLFFSLVIWLCTASALSWSGVTLYWLSEGTLMKKEKKLLKDLKSLDVIIKPILYTEQIFYSDVCNKDAPILITRFDIYAVAQHSDIQCEARFITTFFTSKDFLDLFNAAKYMKFKHIPIEQPLFNQFQYMAQHSQIQHIALSFSDKDDPSQIASIKRYAKKKGITITSLLANDPLNAIQQLKELPQKIDALLVGYESPLMSRKYIKALLLTSAHNKLPVFGGLNKSYVDAGFIAGLHSHADEYADKIKELLEEYSLGFPVNYVDNPTLNRNTRLMQHHRLKLENEIGF